MMSPAAAMIKTTSPTSSGILLPSNEYHLLIPINRAEIVLFGRPAPNPVVLRTSSGFLPAIAFRPSHSAPRAATAPPQQATAILTHSCRERYDCSGPQVRVSDTLEGTALSLLSVPIGKNAPREVHAIIEIPK